MLPFSRRPSWGLPLVGLSLAFSLSAPTAAQVSVLTQNGDNARTGANTAETALTPANVNKNQFGKLFTIINLDANVNGQVLYVPNVTINGASHNVLYAYQSDNTDNSPCGLAAFDADNGAQLWRDSSSDPSPILPASATYTTATPVIDSTAGIIYVLSKSSNDDTGKTYLHAIDITTGKEKPGSPFQVQATAKGTGDGNVNGVVSFDGPASSNRFHANDRPALLLLNGVVYAAFAHNSDSYPYHGWILGYGYDGAKFTQKYVFCTTPNGGDGGIWMSGKGPTVDASGNIYVSIGNGTFDANSKGITSGTDYGMCYLKLSPTLQVLDWFAPYDEKTESDQDLDLGNSGVVGIPGTTSLFGGGTKFGSGFLLDSGNLGHFNAKPSAGFDGVGDVVQRFDHITGNDSVGQNPIAWNAGGGVSYVYLWANGSNLEQFQVNQSTGKISPVGVYKQAAFTDGGSLAVSSSGTSNGVLWAVGYNNVVRAFDATDVSKPEFWDSGQAANSRDALGSVGHFQFPTVASGKVYVPTGSHSIAVYGLLPSSAPATPTFSPGAGTYTAAQNVMISDTTTGAQIYYTTDGSAPGASSTPYTGPVTVGASETLKAVAILNGVSSAVGAAAYTISKPQNVTLMPLADASVEAGRYVNTNFGSSPLLICKKVSNDSRSLYNRADYLKFDLSGVTTSPAHATLTLTVNAASNPARYSEQVQAYTVTDTTWTESGITWNNAPGLNRTNFSSTGTLLTTVSVPLKPGTATLDLTAFVQAHRGQVVTVQLVDASRQGLYLALDSKEASTGAPQLAISY